MRTNPFGSTANIHSACMGALWGPLVNLSVMIAAYSYRKYSFFTHAVFGIFACSLTLVSSIPILNTTGIVPTDSTIHQHYKGSTLHWHYIIGILCLIALAIEIMLGILTRLMNIAGRKSENILLLKKIHQLFGYLALVLCKINIYII
jgi:hypothetical protein